MNNGPKPSFGFKDLSDIQPSPAPPEPAAVEIDRAGERLGFASREAPVRRKRRQQIEEPVEQFNLRAAVADINTFVDWCEEKRLSYREGFGELMKMIRL